MKKSSFLKITYDANALQYTLIISVVIFVLVLTLMMYFHVNTLISYSKDQKVSSIRNHQNVFVSSDADNGITITSKPWGAFHIDKSITTSDLNISDGFNQIGLTIHPWSKNTIDQIHLPISNSYLQLSGKTKLDGQITVPYGIVKTTSAGGRIYEGGNLNQLQVKESFDQLPKESIESYSFSQWRDIESDSLTETLSSRLSRSFKDQTICYFQNESIEIYDQVLTGNIKIVSNQKITIHPDASLRDVMLIAPVIEIKPRTKLTAHLVARDSILISENSLLKFPSSVTIANSTNDQSFIEIKKNTMIQGLIYQFSIPKENWVRPNLIINEKSLIDGYIFNNGFTAHSGIIKGGITTKEFLALERGTLYRNYIIDGVVEKSDSDHDLLSLMRIDGPYKYPVKWMY